MHGSKNRSAEEISHSTGRSLDGGIALDQSQDLVIGHLGVRFVGSLLDEVSLETELDALVPDVHPVVVERELGHRIVVSPPRPKADRRRTPV